MAKKIYKEKQHFKSLEIVFFIAFFMLLVLSKLVRELSIQDGSSTEGIICISLLLLGALGLRMLYNTTLKISISEDYIRFKMTPWHATTKKVAWEDIEDCKIIKTPLYAQWHGGNIAFGQQKYFTLSGKNGVCFTTKDGTTYFLGSQDVDALEVAVSDAFHKAQSKPSYQQDHSPITSHLIMRPV